MCLAHSNNRFYKLPIVTSQCVCFNWHALMLISQKYPNNLAWNELSYCTHDLSGSYRAPVPNNYSLILTTQWSYGVTCWEVFSGGKTPYPGVHPASLTRMLEGGYRLEQPNNTACPADMWVIELTLFHTSNHHLCEIRPSNIPAMYMCVLARDTIMVNTVHRATDISSTIGHDLHAAGGII